ncbi:hypothetical protein P167DRAFT_606112 [Morchella conica CCBAS932]|uniref:Uncharacterized protein n=1 Tax=Morchella conica CCBAS932 TaxID=1392247 RepID=A0A3N4KUE4_9PEZI|nr:hypothetical protein P167DRAFT_606112 [Morchella conica CCBAS932]
MTATAHILHHLLPLDSVHLGRLVLNAKRPHQEFHDPLLPRPHPTDILTTTLSPYSETRKFTTASNLRSYFGKTLSFAYTRHDDTTATLSGSKVTTYELKNSDTWFRAACAEEKTREPDCAYLIVGFRVLHDGEVDKSATSKQTGGSQGEAPTDPIVSAFVAPGVSGSRSSGDTQQLSYKTQGEQVFAVLYRKVKLWFLSAPSVDNMALEADYRWKSCWDWRDFEYKLGDVREGVAEEEEEVDITEVTLVDEDLELSEGEDEEDEEDEEDWDWESGEGADGEGSDDLEVAVEKLSSTVNMRKDRERLRRRVRCRVRGLRVIDDGFRQLRDMFELFMLVYSVT